MLQRMNDLAVQYNNGTQNTDSQAALSAEFDALTQEIDRIQTSTQFNGVALFNNASVDFQVGTTPTDVLSVDLSGSVDTSALDITDNTTVTDAITATSTLRGTLGAVQNRFEHTINNLNVAVENLSASESRIRDTDMASEMVNFTRANILSQAGTAMLAQANQAPQSVLQLLR
jgi:flagellin